MFASDLHYFIFSYIFIILYLISLIVDYLLKKQKTLIDK